MRKCHSHLYKIKQSDSICLGSMVEPKEMPAPAQMADFVFSSDQEFGISFNVKRNA